MKKIAIMMTALTPAALRRSPGQVRGKKKIAIIMTALILAVLTGCPDPDTDPEPEPVIEERAAVNFSTGISTDRSVGRAVGTSWESDDAIGVFMLESGETAVADNASNRRYVTSGGDGSFAPANGDAVIYYPADRRGVDFIAYYPYAGTLQEFKYPVDVKDQTCQAKIDLMTADRVSTPAQNANPVALTFKHRLSKLELEIKPGTNLTDGDLKGLKVEITGQRVTGSFDITTNTLTPTGAEGNSIVFKMAENGKSGEGIMLPGAAQAGRQLLFTLGSRRFSYTISAKDEFKPGTWNTYTITLKGSAPSSSPGEQDISVEAVIEDWGKGWSQNVVIDEIETGTLNISGNGEGGRFQVLGGATRVEHMNPKGNNDINSTDGRETKWSLYLQFKPGADKRSIDMIYTYGVSEQSGTGEETMLQIVGTKNFSVSGLPAGAAITKVNAGPEFYGYPAITFWNYSVSGQNHGWIGVSDTSGHTGEWVDLQVKIDGPGEDLNNIGFRLKGPIVYEYQKPSV